MQCSCVILSSVAFSAHLPHFPINGMIFERVIEHKMCVQIFSTDFIWKILILRSEENVIKNVYWSSCKVPVILLRFDWNMNFLNRFWENTEIWISWKSLLRDQSCSMQTDEWTDGQIDATNLTVAFRNFEKSP